MSKIGMEALVKFGYFLCYQILIFTYVNIYFIGKHARTLHKVHIKKPLQSLELVHSDVCGHMPTNLLRGELFFVLLIDYATHKVWTYLGLANMMP